MRLEGRILEWADAARFTHWVGLVLLGSFLVALINATPLRIGDTSWQLNLIGLLLSNGGTALLGALLLCLGRLFNPNDAQIFRRAGLVRTLATWVALGWLLLIPLQLFLSVRLINTQAGQEIGQIRTIERASRAVRSATSEDELRAAMAQIPNQPPLPKLTVPLEIGKANLLAQFQKTINTAKTRQEELSSNRWQTWSKEAFRNCLQSALLTLGFLAIGKNRLLTGQSPGTQPSPSGSRSRSRSRSRR